MRLTHLKLAGFKSFVDTTTIKINGDRAGIVGPNGCGKSNVMESVRWVLGESSAKELRGDSMDAVIFNGSENRKPISRASVELIFDNSAGTAAGEWSQYAEISVKRVIEREKGSTYYINNSVVRKKDVADLFLGTGLGARAYAIIGQNTINRIVEAKPEELRVFLEEAAGISKYKERRRETELRLRDTRENLTRVEDILQELEKQIERLEGQAEVAAKYTRLQEDATEISGQVLLLQKQQSYDRWQTATRQTQQLVNELEAKVAELRHHESALETARIAHIESTDLMNQSQANYYAVNAEVSSLEGKIHNIQDNHARMQMQLEQFSEQVEKHAGQRREIEMSLDDAMDAQMNLEADYEATESQLADVRERVDEKTNVYQQVMESFQNSQQALNSAEQSLKIEQNAAKYQQQSFEEAERQVEQLTMQLSQMVLPNDGDIETLSETVLESQATIEAMEGELQLGHEQEHQLQDSIQHARASLQGAQKALHTIEAEAASLEKLQQAMRSEKQGNLTEWLQKAGLSEKPRLWQQIKVASGWEAALEAALSGRLNALIDAVVCSDPPPNAITLIDANDGIENHPSADSSSLINYLQFKNATIAPVMQDWLSGVFVAEDHDQALKRRSQLSLGQILVTKRGDVYSKHSVSYFGPQSQLHGVLERQAELERCQNELPLAEEAVASAQEVLQRVEAEFRSLRERNQSLTQNIKQHQQQFHQDNLKLQQLQQQLDSALTRKSAIEDQIQDLKEKSESLRIEFAEHEEKLELLSQQIESLSGEKSAQESLKTQAEIERNDARTLLQRLEQQYREQDFEIKLNNKTVAELSSKLEFLEEEQQHALSRQAELKEALSRDSIDDFSEQLEQLLNKQQASELKLAEAKNHHSDCEATLHGIEKDRIQTEQQLHPMRDKVESSRLSEQEKRLQYEQYARELKAVPESEEDLEKSLAMLNATRQDKPFTVKDLENKLSRTQREIEALGAVNLAAIQELEAETTRRDLLVQQSDDLLEASDTLENAIRKIDRETRGRLQATYEEANANFSELFSTLFNGGRARLELLGDEILDTGIQVFAQPPGKKNSTIHLLSGGEKAMTAIALVFALFRLNPAPFCLMDEVDAPLDDSNTERFCNMVKQMSAKTQFLYVSHNKITMEMAQQLIGVTMQESGVSRIVDVDMEEAVKMAEA